MADQWHVRREKQRFGPYTAAQLRQMAADGRLLQTDLIRKEGSQKWVPASAVKGLFGTTKPVPPPLPVTEQDDDPEPVPQKANRRRHPGLPIWIWAGVGVGGLGLLVACVLLVVFVGGKPTNPGPGDQAAKDSKTGQTTGDQGRSPVDRVPAAEFFAPKVDYTKGPKGQALKEYKEIQDGEQIQFTAFVIEGGNRIPHGSYSRFDLSGKKKSETWFFDGREHGPHFTWHPNGKLEKQGGHKERNRQGLFKEWFENGNLSRQCAYVDGDRNGLFEDWFENGKPSRRCLYVDGEKHGIFTDWSEDGKCVTEMEFVHGVPQPFNPNKATRQQFEAAIDMACDGQTQSSYAYDRRPDCAPADWFFRIFGKPVSGYTGQHKGPQTWNYRCSDGNVALHVGFPLGGIFVQVKN